MALDWLPVDDRPLRPLQPRRGETLTPMTVATIPVPDLLASETFFPVDARPARPTRTPRGELVLPFLPPLAPVAWLDSVAYPARLLRIPASEVSEPPPGAQVVIAERLSWLPLASPRPHVTPPPLGETLEILFPGIAAAGEPCVEWADGPATATTFITEALTSTDLTTEAAVSTTFLAEDLC